jgi:AhpD family alkylhydroperoxidase
MTTFSVPTRDDVTPENQAVFDNLKKMLGFVPNLYATFALSPTALPTYLALQNAKSSLKPKEREVINLVVSQVNGCDYCLAAHTALGKRLGFTEAQIAEIRRGGVLRCEVARPRALCARRRRKAWACFRGGDRRLLGRRLDASQPGRRRHGRRR